jgi:hypothetical protein
MSPIHFLPNFGKPETLRHRVEMVNTTRKKRKGHQLFNDNPRGRPRTAGIGYGSAKKARASLKKIRGKAHAYQTQVATTMYYRAKHHKYQTPGMRNAMKVYGNWLGK